MISSLVRARRTSAQCEGQSASPPRPAFLSNAFPRAHLARALSLIPLTSPHDCCHHDLYLAHFPPALYFLPRKNNTPPAVHTPVHQSTLVCALSHHLAFTSSLTAQRFSPAGRLLNVQWPLPIPRSHSSGTAMDHDHDAGPTALEDSFAGKYKFPACRTLRVPLS